LLEQFESRVARRELKAVAIGGVKRNGPRLSAPPQKKGTPRK